MKKRNIAIAIILTFAMLMLASWFAIDNNDVYVHVGDETIEGPLGALIGMVAGSFGLLVGFCVMVFVAALLGVVFAGVGVLLVGVFALVALLLAGAAIPFLLPLLVPLAIVWWIARRNKRKHTLAIEHAAV